jgi:hypothetical protein
VKAELELTPAAMGTLESINIFKPFGFPERCEVISLLCSKIDLYPHKK